MGDLVWSWAERGLRPRRFAGPPGPVDTASDPWGLEDELLFDKLRSPL